MAEHEGKTPDRFYILDDETLRQVREFLAAYRFWTEWFFISFSVAFGWTAGWFLGGLQ